MRTLTQPTPSRSEGTDAEWSHANRVAAFEHLYGEMVPRVRGLVRRLVADPDLRGDIVQETFVRAYVKHLHAEEGREQWPWLATVARNLSLDALRRRRLLADEPIDDESAVSTRRSADPVAEHAAATERSTVTDVLFELTPQQRRILVLCHVEGCSYRELAEREGMSVEAVRSSLARARRLFRRRYVAASERRQRPPARVDEDGVPAHGSASGNWWFEQLIEQHVGALRRLVFDVLGDTPAAREVVKETFRRARRQNLHLDAPSGRSDRSVWPWLATTGRNLAVAVARERATSDVVHSDTEPARTRPAF